MTPSEVAFLRRLASLRPTEVRHDGVAARMAALHQLGAVIGSRVRYGQRDYAAAADMLTNRGLAMEAPKEPFKRSQAPAGESEKTGALPVTRGLLGAVPMNMPHSLAAPAGGFLVLHWSAALAMPYEVLLVSENLEPLMQLLEYTWLEEFVRGRPTLAVFRGTKGLLRPDAPAQLLATDTRPVLAFFDFDPKGLSMAAALPRREALCLLPWPQMQEATRQGRRTRLYTKQVQWSRAHLDGVADPEIALTWQRLKSLSCGLDQERFPRRRSDARQMG